MRKVLFLIFMSFFLVPSTLWGSQPKILGFIPDLEQKLQENPSQAQLQELLLKNILQQLNIQTVQDYAAYLNQHMSYKADTQDIWEAPLQTLARGFGDCEDLSFLTAAVLEYFGYQPHIIGFKEKTQAHVIVIVNMEDGLYIFDNTTSVKAKVKDLDGIASFLHQTHGIDFIVEINRAPRRVHMLYTKDQLQQLARK